MGLYGEEISTLRRVMVLSFMSLLAHQFEEYAIPGGFPVVWNMAVMGEREYPDRYPLNRQNCFYVNIAGGYTFYMLAIIFPNLIWLGIANILFGALAQFIVHGIYINRRMKSFYNPGLGAVIFLHIPVACYYLWYVYTNGLMQAWYWPAGIACLLISLPLVVVVPVNLLKSRHSDYPFSSEEMQRFRVREKLAKLYSSV
jgi:hypothetical protein